MCVGERSEESVVCMWESGESDVVHVCVCV